MVNFPGRNGRRRRVLNEEVLSGSSSQAARRAASDDGATQHAPRYSDAAGVENHAQITDYIPRRYRTIVLLLLAGPVSAVTLGALHYIAPTVASAGIAGTEAFDLAAAGTLADWVAAVVLLAASVTCLLIYSIRRHRIDDYRGRYRVWLAASAACLALSANSVAGLHHVLAYAAAHFTGWTALRGGAAWWLIVAGPPLAWISIRTFFDVKECRLAGMLLMVAFICHVAAAASYLGFLPGMEPQIETLVSGVATLLGYWSVLAAVTTYARFVVLDAQGLIQGRPIAAKRRAAKSKAEAKPKSEAAKPTVLSAGNYTRSNSPQIQPAKTPADSKSWIDGSRPERESYDDADDDDGDSSSGPSKLSKADRKRLRKLKAQNRAA